MRLVQVLLSKEHSESALSILDEEGIDYLIVETSGSDSGAATGDVLVEFPLPDQAVEYVKGRFDEAGIERCYVITLTAESAQTERFEELEDRFMTGTEEGDSISPDELRTTALNLHPDPLPYYSMTVISALVAVAGLLVDSAALVVGAMVIAPQVGSALTASIGATMGDWAMLKRGARAQVLSLSLAIAAVGLVIVVELHSFTAVRLSPGFAVVPVAAATMAAAALWAILQWGFDLALGWEFARTNDELMIEFLYSAIFGVGAGVVFASYFRRIDPTRDRLPPDAIPEVFDEP